jgi:hypothetical protein
MLKFLLGRGQASERKFRLFACACCRRIWDLFPDPRNRDMVVAIEDHPDGTFGDPDLHEAICASSAREYQFRDRPAYRPAYWVARDLGWGFYKMTAGESAFIVARRAVSVVPDGPEPRAQTKAQAGLLRDILGPLPIRPVVLGRSVLAWNDRTVPRIAQGIYDERRMPEGTLDTGRLAILSDALLDAGCDDEGLILHCRSEGPHVRGCWAVDLILGKE